MDSKKEKDRLSDIILGRVGLMGNFLSDPVSTSPEPPVDTPDRERRSRAAEMTSPEEYKRRFPLPSPRSGRPCTLTGGCTAGSPCWSGHPAAGLHMEEHREDIAGLLGEVYRPWDDEDGTDLRRPSAISADIRGTSLG